MAARNEARIYLVADDKGFHLGMNKAAKSLATLGQRVQAIGGTMQAVGARMTRSITLPLVAAGAASVKLALNYEEAMSHIRGVNQASAKDMALYEASVLKMARNVGKAPQELAEALYFVTSAGFEGSKALKILEQSAKASAAGMGKTETIADALTSALNVYRSAGLSAAKATDIMTAAVRVGKMEPEEMAGNIGKVIPMAKQMKVGFGEVAASLSAMTLAGIKTDEAAVALNQFFTTLLKPTKQGVEALKSVKLSYSDLRKELAEKGVVATMRTLTQAFKGNTEGLVKVLGNARATRAVLAMTGLTAKQLDEVFKGVSKSAGDMNSAFEEAEKTSGHKLRKALATLQATGIEIGTKLAPSLARVAEQVANLIGRFSELSPHTQDAIIKFALLAAAAGPVLSIFGKLTSAVGALIKVWAPLKAMLTTTEAVGFFSAGKWVTTAGGVSRFAAVLGPLPAVLAAVGGGMYVLYRHSESFRNSLNSLGSSLKDVFASAAPLVQKVVAAIRTAVEALYNFIRSNWSTIGPILTGPFKTFLTIATTTLDAVAALLRAVAAVLRGDWREAWSAAKAIVTSVMNGIKTIVTNVAQSMLTTLRVAWGGLRAIATSAWGVLKGVVSAAMNAALAAVLSIGATIINWFKGLGGKIKGAVGNLGHILYDIGRSIITGLWNGLRSAWDGVAGWLSGIGSKIKSLKGPIDKDRALLEPEGRAIMQGLALGMKVGLRDVTAVATTTALAIANAMSKALSGFGSAKAKKLKLGAEMSGPIGSVLQWVVDAQTALTTLSQRAIPTLDAEVKAAAVQFAGVVAAFGKTLAAAVNKVFPKGAEKSGLSKGAETSGLLGGIVGDVVGIVQSLVQITVEQIDAAILGVQHAAYRAPDLAQAVVKMVKALQGAFAGIAIEQAFADLQSNVASIVGSVTSVIGSLFGLMPGEAREGERQWTISGVVAAAIEAADTITEHAAELGARMRGMLEAIGEALGVVDAETITGLRNAMESFSSIASSIKTIIDSLAEITDERISAASSAGERVGNGFLSGLKAWHASIVSEAESVNRDVISALAGEGASGAAGRMAVAVREAIDQAVASALAAVAREVAAT